MKSTVTILKLLSITNINNELFLKLRKPIRDNLLKNFSESLVDCLEYGIRSDNFP